MHRMTYPQNLTGKDQGDFRTVEEQLSTLTQLLNQLIRERSAGNFSTAITRIQQTHARGSPSQEAGASGALPAKEIGSMGSPLDMV